MILNIQNHAMENAAVSVVFWVAFGLRLDPLGPPDEYLRFLHDELMPP